MTTLSPTPRSTLTRKKNRAATDRRALYEVLDEAVICHVGLVLDGSSAVLPTGYGRDADRRSLHGSIGPGKLATGTACAGVLPVRTSFGTPIPASYVPSGATVPEHVAGRVFNRD